MISNTYQALWTATAQQDFKKILEYIAADSVNQARKVYYTTKQKAGNLSQLPLQGRVVPELKYYGILTYREPISTPWRVIYKVEENKVWVLAVIDGRRNVEDILLDRFI